MRLLLTYRRLTSRIRRQKHGDRRLRQRLELHRWQGKLARVIPRSTATAAMSAKTQQVSDCGHKMHDDPLKKDVRHSTTSTTIVLMSCILFEDCRQSFANSWREAGWCFHQDEAVETRMYFK